MNTKSLTVLVSSVSKKIPLIRTVRNTFKKMRANGKIVGADSNSNCIGKYFVDEFWEMPSLQTLSPDEFIAYCQFHYIQCVIPTRDGELLFYASNRSLFEQQGIFPMVSDPESVRICLDKLQFYNTMIELGYPAIETVKDPEDLECDSWVVKEQFGAGSQNMGLALTAPEAVKHAKRMKSPVFQPFIEGDEISADLYVDKKGNNKGVILRTRDLIVNGESQITKTFRNETLENMCAAMAVDLNLYGHVMFQFIHQKVSDVYYILECNPRFGGASPLSVEAGLESFRWFFLEASGKDIHLEPFNRSEKELRLVRYPEDLFIV